MTTSSAPTVIIGKNAKTGSRVNQRLILRGIETRPVSRSTPIPFDWKDRTTWSKALKGAKAAYVTYQPDLAVPNAERDIAEFVELAKQEGLEHIVLLSGRGESGAERAEQILRKSGLDWNVVRASWFAQNFSESFLIDGVLSGQVALPAGDTQEPFIDVDDIADTAVAALTDREKRNQLFEVTGPELLTFKDCVDEIAKQLNKEIHFVSVPIDDYMAILKDQNVPDDFCWLLKELFTVVFDGRNSHLSHGVEQATGKTPTTFAQYVAKTVKSGHWQ